MHYRLYLLIIIEMPVYYKLETTIYCFHCFAQTVHTFNECQNVVCCSLALIGIDRRYKLLRF